MTSEMPKQSARVANTVIATNIVRAESDPAIADSLEGPWVNTVFQVPQP